MVRSRKTVLVLATMNEGKAREIAKGLGGLPVKVVTLAEAGIRSPYPEKGTTFEENAAGKSLFYGRRSDHLTLAEDSGLEIEALDGAPGIFSARFSGRRPTDEKNIRKVLRLMKDAPSGARRARFVCCMVLSIDGRTIKTAIGRVRGEIKFEKKGEFGFGYDPIFFYKPLGKTFGELKPSDKNAVSHRGRALNKMKEFLRGYLKDRPSPFPPKRDGRK